MSSNVEAQQIKPTSLYVGDLHPLVSDALLFTKFGEIGPVINARVCRDMVSRESLGYGYVNFRDHKDAEQALELINYGVFFGRPFRLMWCQKDPTMRKSGRGNIFVKNLEKSILPTELYDTFEQFGKILSCKLAMDDKGQSKGFGFVHFESEENAQHAIDYVNGKEIRNRILYVGPFIPKNERNATGSAAKFNNCYVKNFGEEMDDERFRKLFEKYGEIKSACVMKNDQGISKGFGFVCFEDPSSAENAVKEMDGTDMNGKILYVGRAQRKEERQEELKAKYEKQRSERQSRYVPGVNIYVKNLEDNITDEKLHEIFSKFGEITSAKVMRDANGQSRSFGFVCFKNPEQATITVSQMNSIMVGSKPLYVAIAQRKEDRRVKLAAEHQARIDQFRTQIMPMHHQTLYNLSAAPTAGYGANRAFYTQRPYLNAGPRWNQPVNAAMSLGGNQAYQAAGAGQAAGGQQYMMRNTGAPNAGQLGGRAGGGPTAANINVGPNAMNYNRQSRQIPSMNQAGVIQQRVGMSNVNSLMPNRTNPGVMAPSAGQIRADMSVMANANRYNAAQPARTMPQQTVMPVQVQPPANQKEQEDSMRMALGNRLFPHVEKLYPDIAGKLTGVLLSLGNNQVSALFDDTRQLEAKINEAYKMLQSKATDSVGDKNKDVKAN